MKKYYFLVIAMVCFRCVSGQVSDSVNINGHYYKLENPNINFLSSRNFNRVLNRLFGQVAVGSSGGTDLANYASADPVNGKFSFNGYGSLASKDSALMPVFMSLNVQGDLIGTGSTQLFTNSKLNTGASVSLKLHFGLSHKTITYLEDANSLLNARRDSLLKVKLFELRKVQAQVASNTQQVALNSFRMRTLDNNLTERRKALRDISDSAGKYSAADTQLFEKFVDSAMKISQKIDDLVTDSFNLSRKMDTLQNNQALINSTVHHTNENRYAQQRYLAIQDSYHQQIDSLELKAPLNRAHFFWKTLTFAFNRQKYYTYTDSAAFSNRISKQILDALEIGASVNFFWENFGRGNLFYANLGVSRKKDNNTADLATTEVDEEIDSDSAQVKRKVANKYNAFTEPVVEYTSWLTYFNAWYMWGKHDKSGVHLNQEVDFRESHDTRINIGFGYIFSFTDKKDNKTIINLEAYIKFLDITNSQKDNSRFYSRNAIGVNVGLPFNYIF